MQKHLSEHFFSLLFVSAIFLGLIIYFSGQRHGEKTRRNSEIETYLQLDFLDFGNPMHKALFRETLDIYFPVQKSRNDSLLRAIENYRANQILASQQQARSAKMFSGSKLWQLAGMYANFILAYMIVMLLTYYGVQTLAVLRFVRMKQGRTSYLAEFATYVQKFRDSPKVDSPGKMLLTSASLLGKALLKGAAYFILFSPAYVIAYSFKTRFDTDTFFFMVLLGVISNGLLITYAQKFYTFLIGESRKGYVQTAIVKNLHNSYAQRGPEGISRKAILRLRKRFPGHVFGHIYENANHQYRATVKEQASFLITGLVIIEMALNIQGHLCYELLQTLLFKQYDVALAIILGIFWIVKATEMLTDARIYLKQRRLGIQ